jgi:TonB family protein
MIMDRRVVSRIASLALTAGLIAAAAPARAVPTSVTDRISAAVARVMDYPRGAEPREEEGVVVARFTIGRTGGAEAIALLESSGHLLLDQAALQALTRVHNLPTEAIGKRSIAILQYRFGGPGRDPEAAHRLQTAVDQLESLRRPALLSAGYAR